MHYYICILLLETLDMAAKGIAGRAILVDWHRWAQNHKLDIDVMSSYEVPFGENIEALLSQGVDPGVIRPGDIILIRFGYIDQYNSMASGKRAELHELYKSYKPNSIGVKSTKELLEFLWTSRIAAVGGDSPSFEV